MSDIVLAFEPPAVGQGVGITNQYDSVLGSTINGVDFQSGVLLSRGGVLLPLAFGDLVTHAIAYRQCTGNLERRGGAASPQRQLRS